MYTKGLIKNISKDYTINSGILDRNLKPQEPRSKYKKIYVQPKNDFAVSMLANQLKH